MPTIIRAETETDPEYTIVPDSVTGYRAQSPSGNRIHERPGTGDVDVMLRPAGPRAGRLEVAIDDEHAAYAAEEVLRRPAVWTFTSDERPTLGMRFVIDDGGTVTRELDPYTGATWHVGFDWRAIV